MTKFFGGGSTTSTPSLDPAAQNALNQVVSQSTGLAAQNPPFVAPFDAATIAGLQGLQDRPQSPFIGAGAESLTNLVSPGFPQTGALSSGLGQVDATLGGSFFGANPGVGGFNAGLQGVESAITDAATRAVGDQFSLAGRTGSPAQSITLGRTVARELAPFQFGAFENQRNREFQGFENERQRQLGAAQLGLGQFNTGVGQQLSALSLTPGLEGLQDAQSFRLLGVGDAIQQQNQAALTEPLQAFQFFANPLLSAAGGFPVSNTLTDRASGFDVTKSVAGILGGFSQPQPVQ